MKISNKIKLWWWKKTHVIEPIKIAETHKVETINVVKQYNPRKFNEMSNEELLDDLVYDIGKIVLKYTKLVFLEDQFNDTIEVKAQVKAVAR